MLLNIYLLIFVVNMVFIIAWLLKLSQFYLHIKKNDLKTFEYLGRPEMFKRKNFTTTLKLARYLLNKEYLNFEDQITKEKAILLRFVLLTTLSLMVFGSLVRVFGELCLGIRI